jgi:hypothetical protein
MDGLKCFHIQLDYIPSFDVSTAQELNVNLGSSGSKATRLNDVGLAVMQSKILKDNKSNYYAFLANWVDDNKLNTLFFHNIEYKSDAPTDNYDVFHCWSFQLGRDANIRARKITADHTLLFKRLMTLANQVWSSEYDSSGIAYVDNEWSKVPIEFRNNPINRLQGESYVSNDWDVDDIPRWDIVKPEVDSFLNNADNVGDWYPENSFEWRTAN